MRVLASIQFVCATTGLQLETQLSTETRNLAMFRQGHISMTCSFCGQQHYWRLVKYHRETPNRQLRSEGEAQLGGIPLEIR